MLEKIIPSILSVLLSPLSRKLKSTDRSDKNRKDPTITSPEDFSNPPVRSMPDSASSTNPTDSSQEGEKEAAKSSANEAKTIESASQPSSKSLSPTDSIEKADLPEEENPSSAASDESIPASRRAVRRSRESANSRWANLRSRDRYAVFAAINSED